MQMQCETCQRRKPCFSFLPGPMSRPGCISYQPAGYFVVRGEVPEGHSRFDDRELKGEREPDSKLLSRDK